MPGRCMRLAALLLLSGCAGTIPRMPGPTSMVGRIPEAWQRPALLDTKPTKPSLVAGSQRHRPTDALGAFREQVLAASQYYLDNVPFRDDCSGYVCAVYAKVGIPIDGSVKQIWDRAQEAGAIHHRKIPNPGDIAFFDNTYDANHNRKLDDFFSHMALVLQVYDDGTILLAHGGSSHGRTTLLMNLQEPDVHRREDGREVNDYLRRATKRDRRGTKYLASQLWRGFATVKPDEIEAWLAS
jgi:hypothetical protein